MRKNTQVIILRNYYSNTFVNGECTNQLFIDMDNQFIDVLELNVKLNLSF